MKGASYRRRNKGIDTLASIRTPPEKRRARLPKTVHFSAMKPPSLPVLSVVHRSGLQEPLRPAPEKLRHPFDIGVDG